MSGWFSGGADGNAGGRPCGDLRGAVLQELRSLPTAASWVDVAPRLGGSVDPYQVRNTINNLARAGLVQRVGRKAAPGINRGVTLYSAASDAPAASAERPWCLLQGVWGSVVAVARSDAPEAAVRGAHSWGEFA